MKPELDGDASQARIIAGRVSTTGVPVQTDVAILEQPVAGHEDLGRPTLLRRAAVEANCSLDVAGLDLFGDCHRRRRRCHAEQVMPTRLSVTAASFLYFSKRLSL